MKLSRVITISFILFCIVYTFSLSLNYVEGDDALNIAYHALGRNPAVQPKYAEYHGMMDMLLSNLPADETTVRVTGIIVTAFCAWVMYVLMILIATHISKLQNKKIMHWAFLFIPLIAPEFFFIGLTYTPAVVSMTFILLSHWLLINKNNSLNDNAYKILIALIFGFGASIRWDCSLYILVVLLERLFNQPYSNKVLLNLTIQGAYIILFSTLFILISISDFETIKHLLLYRSTHTASGGVYTNYSFRSVLGNIAFFTPGFLLLITFGFIQIISSRRYDLIFLLLFSLTFIFPILGLGIFATGTLKRIFCIAPILLAIALEGAEFMLTFKKWSKILATLLAVLVIVPFIFGIRMYAEDSCWGPGFETQLKCKSKYQIANSFRLEQKKKDIGYEFTLGPGFAYMTEEGPRPLGGFIFVLIGSWRKFNNTWNNQKNAIIDSAIINNIPIIQEKETAYPVTYLCKLGYKTKDPATTNKTVILTNETFARRNFINKQLDTVILVNYQGDYRYDFMNSEMRNILANTYGEKIYVHAQYSTTIRKLCSDSSIDFTAYSPFTGKISFK